MPKVSIVLPTYNGQDFIRESIESVISQTFRDWELIIVNDCSTDESISIIEFYAKSDQRIKIINNQSNQKLPKSLNIGFNNSQGEYLTWTSDDNIYLPHAIEKMVEYLDKNNREVMVCTRINYISEDKKILYKSVPYTNEYMCYSDCLGACFLYRRDVLNVIGGYNPDFFLVEDYEYWLRILFKYKNIGFIDEVLYNYRKQSKSLTSTRMKEILYNNSKMRVMHLKNIANGLKNKKDLLIRMYFEIEKYYYITDESELIFRDYIGNILSKFDSAINGKVIVYGAGQIGKYFLKNYKDSVEYFADRDINKIGTDIDGVPVISLSDMKKKSHFFQIVIAAGIEKIPDFIETLNELNIDNYYIYKDGWI